MKIMEERKHALLSPSAAHRWMHCTAAPMLEKDVPDAGSPFAEEGTLAHAYCAKKLKELLGLPTEEEDAEIAALKDKYHTGEMDEHTDTYARLVWEEYLIAKRRTKDAQLLVEVKLDFGDYVPGSFGTSDAIIIADGKMEVIDFKYGKGVEVSAVENPQMMIYALGAYDRFAFEYDIDRVEMTIIQPRLDNLSAYGMDTADLLAWARYALKPKAEEAYAGGRQLAGDWCRFCKVKATCRAIAGACFDAYADNEDPKLVSPDKMAKDILPMLPTIKTWLTGVEEYSLEQALAGVKYEGYKLVEGRSIRKITDQKMVDQRLNSAGYKYDDYMKPPELRSLTDLEKLCGKKRFAELCGEFVHKPQGKPALVPESDKRQPLEPVKGDFDGFAAEN